MNIIRCNLNPKINDTVIKIIHTIITVKRYRKMDIVEFTEECCGIKLKAYQKMFLRLMDKNKNLQLITPRQYRR